jgi:hypothetical protein
MAFSTPYQNGVEDFCLSHMRSWHLYFHVCAPTYARQHLRPDICANVGAHLAGAQKSDAQVSVRIYEGAKVPHPKMAFIAKKLSFLVKNSHFYDFSWKIDIFIGNIIILVTFLFILVTFLFILVTFILVTFWIILVTFWIILVTFFGTYALSP